MRRNIRGCRSRVLEKYFLSTTGVEETLHNIFEAVGSLGECDAIGISCGGPLDGERGIILSPPNLPGWDKIRITDMLKERFKVPAFLRDQRGVGGNAADNSHIVCFSNVLNVCCVNKKSHVFLHSM